MKRARKTYKHKGKTITRLPNGSYQISVQDSKGTRTRPSFPTLDEAKRELDGIAAKKTTGQFVATAANTTFGKLLDLHIADREGMVSAERLKTVKGMVGTLRPVFGSRSLVDFERDKMKFVQQWFDESPLTPGYLLDLRRVFRSAFELGAKENIIGRPTPMDAFGIKVRRHRQNDDGAETEVDEKVLQFDEMVAVIYATRRVDREQYIVARMRFVMVMLGLLTGMRPQAYCGLYWDCVDFDGRMIYLRRKCLNSGKIVWGSKTGRKGYAAIPMSPILHAVLLEWRDYLSGLGLPTTGEVPVLVTEGGRRVHVKSVTGGGCKPDRRSGGHWERIARKAGLVDETTEAKQYTAYCLRHTCANMWRASGMDLEDLRALMTHQKISTTSGHYLHEAPHLAVLRREVAAVGLEKTREGLIDGLGIVLAQRWREAGLEIPCSPPRAMSLRQPQLSYQGADEMPALPSNVIEMRPTSVSMDAPAPPAIRSTADFKAWQIAEIKRLRGLGRTKQQICDDLRVGESTVCNALRSADHLRDLKALPKSERVGIQQRCREHYETGRHKTIGAIARAEGVRPSTVNQWAREGGWLPPKEHVAHKLGAHDALIRQRLAEGIGPTAIAREIIALGTSITVPGIIDFARRHGLDNDPAGVAAAKAAQKERVFNYLADGKTYRWIAKAESISTSTVGEWNQERKASCQSQAESGTDLARDAKDVA